jgi:hypothetical protein
MLDRTPSLPSLGRFRRAAAALAVAFGVAHCAGSDGTADGADESAVDDAIVNARPIDGAVPIARQSTVLVATVDGECSGTLVGINRVVTAKHCVQANLPARHSVRFTREQSPQVFYISVGAIKTHPTADVAVLRLVRSVPLGSDQRVAPILSPRQGSIQKGDRVVIAGFGCTQREGCSPGQPLRWGKTTFDSWVGQFRSGSTTYSHGLRFVPEACRGDDPACSSMCKGDSGGPYFQWRRGDGWGLLAVHSSGNCGGLGGVGASTHATDARALSDFILYDQ